MMVRKNGEDQSECLPKDCHVSLNDPVYSDSEMSVEKLDDLMAAVTFGVTVITITLGFLFNL